MQESAPRSPDRKKLRKQLLEAPVDFLPLAVASMEKLQEMGFATLGEAFRAAIAGRLSYRKQVAGKLFEDETLQACCHLLGYNPATIQTLKAYRPKRRETVQEALALLNGGPFVLSADMLATSIREMFLPSGMHEALIFLRAETVGRMMSISLAELKKAGGLGPGTLGNFLAIVFDFLFIIHEPEDGLPPVLQTTDYQASGFPDVGTRLLLTPWFPERALKEGAGLLAAGRLLHPLFLKEHGGALTAEGDRIGRVLLGFGHAPRLSQGFQVINARCQLCDPEGRRLSFCQHAAALALHFLQPHPAGEPCQLPLPLCFETSPWYVVGQILFDLYGQGNPGDITVKPEGGAWRLDMTSKAVQSWFSWLLKPEILQEGLLLYPDKFNLPSHSTLRVRNRHELPELFRQLRGLRRESESAEEGGADQPLLVQREESVWFWLIRTLYMGIPSTCLRIHRPEGESFFALTARDPQTGDEVLSFILPRARTPDVVDALTRCGSAPPVFRARAFARAAFDAEEAALVITPCLELADGRILSRPQLADNLYGRYYYLPGEGFISVQEQAPDQGLGHGLHEITRVSPEAMLEYAHRHRRGFLNRGNQVDAAFRDFTVREMPERLELTGFRLEGDWCHLAGFYGMGNAMISLADLLRSRQKGLPHLPGPGKWLQLKDSPLDWFYSLGADRLNQNGTHPGGTIRLTRREMLMLAALAPELQVAIEQEQEKESLHQLLNVDTWIDQHHLPVIPAHLREYQRNGLAWLYALYRNRLGGILADDMGLGKTHQALGLFKAIQESAPDGTGAPRRFLVVCPATVVAHWLDKATQYYPELKPYVYHGCNRDLDQGADQRLFLTTYGIIRRDAEKLAELKFEVIVFDEIQHLKNKKTDVYSAAACLNARMVIGLTGTPLENSVQDLKALFDLVLPGFLGPDSVFRKQYAEPIEDRGDQQRRNTLSRLLSPFLLRRTRQQVLTELPEVIEHLRTCRLSADQVKLYREMIAGRGRILLHRLADQTERKTPYLEVLALINYLKQICNHPSLMESDSDWRRFESGKWDLFVDLLEQCLASSMKVVVFSHYTKMLDIIEQYLASRGVGHCGLRGAMALRKREENIRRFNTDESCRVFCASLLAGGVGVDLTAAQAVIHYDRWWNAAREDQATARVHRMGQRHVVQTFKLVTEGTLEEKINSLIEKKRELSRQLVREDDASIIKRLSRQDLIELLEWNFSTYESNPPADNPLLQSGTTNRS